MSDISISSHAALLPRHSVPGLDLPLVGGGRFVLGASPPDYLDLLVFYRGLHCPICAKYLMELERLTADFAERGVRAMAVSTDDAARAQGMARKIKAADLPFAYDLSMQQARDWGLYISTSRGTTSIGIEEPALFSEPAVYLVRPDGTLFYGTAQTMPFARPSFAELLGAVDYAKANDYPARGEYIGSV